MDELAKVNVNGKEYHLKDETARQGSGGNVAYDEAQYLTDEQKAQARENIGAQPKGNYLTEVPEGYAKKTDIPSLDGYAKTTDIPSLDGYAKTEDVPTDAEIIQLIKDNTPEPSGGGIAVTGATVGQTVKISAVDENGVPTAWVPTDFPSGGSGGEWKHIASVTLEETTAYIMQEISGSYDNVLIEFENLLRAEGNSGGINVSVNTKPSGATSAFSFGTFIHNSSAARGLVEIEKILDRVRVTGVGHNAAGNGAGSGVGLIPIMVTGDITEVGFSISGYASSKMAAGAVFNFYGR